MIRTGAVAVPRVLAALDRWLRRYHPQVVVIVSGWNCNDSDFAEYRARTGRGAGLARIKLDLLLNDFETYRRSPSATWLGSASGSGRRACLWSC